MAIGLIGEYKQLLEKLPEWQNKYSTAASSFSAAEKNYSEALKNISTQSELTAAYDISNAYSNYLSQQRALRNYGNLATGTQQELKEGSFNLYEQAYKTAKAQQASSFAEGAEKAYSDYVDTFSDITKDIEGIDKDLLKQAEQYRDLEIKAKEYAVSQGLDSDVLSQYTTGKSTEDGKLTGAAKLGWYDLFERQTTPESQSFGDWLSTEDVDLYDLYKSDTETARRLLGGLESADRDVIKSEAVQENNFKEISQIIRNMKKDSKNVQDRLKNKNFFEKRDLLSGNAGIFDKISNTSTPVTISKPEAEAVIKFLNSPTSSDSQIRATYDWLYAMQQNFDFTASKAFRTSDTDTLNYLEEELKKVAEKYNFKQ